MDHPDAESFKQLATSINKLPAALTGQPPNSGGNSSYATARAKLLLGCYRTGDANDPDTYVAAISATLARYSEEIITRVTHPVSGLPSRCSWLPTVKEVFDACEELDEFEREKVARERRIAEQIRARAEQERLAAVKPTLEQLREKYGENWGLTPRAPAKPSTFKAPTPAELTAHYREYGLEFQPKESAE